MIRSKTMKKLGYYNEKFYYAQDYKLMYDFIKEITKLRYWTHHYIIQI